MLTNLSDQIWIFFERGKVYLVPWLICLGILWAINIFNWILGSPLNVLGIWPRRLPGLIGIVFSPILHQNFNHLFFNSIPLFVLGLVLLARSLDIFLEVTILVTLLGGFATWLLGSRGIHIGASGLVSGYFGYILATAYFNPSSISLLLAIIVLYYFGSILLGLFPVEDKISWESHLFGFLSGVGVAFLPNYFH